MNRYYYVITTFCNYSCKFCYMRYGKVKKSSLEILKNNLNNIEHLVLIGGEPTLNIKEVIEVLELTKNVSTINEITLVTNGSLLTNEIVEKLNYPKLYIQVSIYDITTALKISKLIRKRFIIHFLISENNFNLLEIIIKMFYEKVQFWVSIDREIKKDITASLFDLIDQRILKKEMFRDYGYTGKKCLVFNKQNYVINGDELVMDCLHRQSKGTKMIVNTECVKCTNKLCDACVCDDISNRDVICKIFKNLEEYYEYRS